MTTRDVAIIGVGHTKFGKSKKTLLGLLTEASLQAMDDAQCSDKEVDSVYVANMGSGALNRQTAIASALINELGMVGRTTAVAIENGPASGATAIKVAYHEVASGWSDLVLVTGGERMRAVPGEQVTDFVAMMAHRQAEYPHGVTLPGLAGMFARLYMQKYGLKHETLAKVAIKNHANAMHNPIAHIQRKITLDGILLSRESIINNPVIADPLRLYDMCPVSDGSASLLLCPLEKAKEYSDTPIKIAGIGQGTDLQIVHQRKNPLELKAVQIAADKAFKRAKLERKDIDFCELHDAFSILELAESEDAGFFKPGEALIALDNGETEIGGKLPINPSGGLKARGHPVGASGAAQLCELVWQLRGEAGKRQVINATKGFAISFGGFGNNVVATILTRS